MKNLNLKKKTLLLILIPLLITSVVIFFYQTNYIDTNMKKMEDTRIIKVGEFMSPTLALALWNYQLDVIHTITQNALKHNDLSEIVITNDKAEVVYSVGYERGSFINENTPKKKGTTKRIPVMFEEKQLGTIDIFYNYDNIEDITNSFQNILTGLMLFQVLLIIGFSYFALEFGVVTPVKKINNAMFDIAKGRGDLSQRISIATNDETGELAGSFNTFIEKIDALVKSVRTSTDEVSNSAHEVYSGNDQLSNSTQEMASSIEQTTATVEEVTMSIKENANISAKTATEIHSIAKEAQNGSNSLLDMAEAMKSVNTSGERIGQIVAVVNEIAFQTNLLALNAAVEAARAGEHGKGFAVVATEVRELAGRSAEAVAEITEIVENNKSNIANANQLSEETTGLLQGVVERIQGASSAMEDIESRAQGQAVSIEQINIAMGQMDEGTQRNAALVEQLASSSENLSNIASNLQEEFEQFKTSEEKD